MTTRRTQARQAGEVRGAHHREFLVAFVGLAGGIIGAVIGLVATLIATSVTSGDETTRQLRELKQTQYAATYSAVSLEAESITTMLDALQRGDTTSALTELQNYNGRTEVVKQLATLPLLADRRVLTAGTTFLQKRSDFLVALGTLAKTIDRGGKPDDAALSAARAKLQIVNQSGGELLAAMREDLDVPG